MPLVDSHAHLDSPRYDADRDALLERAWQQGVRAVLSIGIGDGPDTMQQALELSRKYAGKPETPRILATAGIHPHEANLADQAALEKLDQLLTSPDVLAVGEIGLDYYYDHSPVRSKSRFFSSRWSWPRRTSGRSSSIAGHPMAAPMPGTTRWK